MVHSGRFLEWKVIVVRRALHTDLAQFVIARAKLIPAPEWIGVTLTLLQQAFLFAGDAVERRHGALHAGLRGGLSIERFQLRRRNLTS
jgi:hypothetical protein